MDDGERIAKILANSKLFREFADAFHATTGVRLCLEPFNQRSGAQVSGDAARTENAGPGMYALLIPVRHEALVIGLLRTGLLLKSPRAEGNGLSDLPVVPKTRRKFIVHMITLFADYLGIIGNRLALQQESCEPAFITNARRYIRAHQDEALHLADVASHVHISSFYLSKMFRKVTGINFSSYVARLRVETAKDLLPKSPLKISEVALEAGFQSLAQFNKTFKKLVGETPGLYRKRLKSAHRRTLRVI